MSEQQDLYVQEYENMQFTLDNGKTNELLNDIAGNMPNGRLKINLLKILLYQIQLLHLYLLNILYLMATLRMLCK